MLKIRHSAVIFFVLYGLLIPVLSPEFFQENIAASLAMIASCCVIALLFYSGHALLLNIIIAFYVLKQYLVRPFVDIFAGRLDNDQLSYILGNDSFFNADDAAVVYISLLSLLSAWLIGLLVSTPKKGKGDVYWIFRRLDEIVSSRNWRLWLTISLIAIVTYRSPIAMWQSSVGGEAVPLFAFGLFDLSIIVYVFFAWFIVSRRQQLGATYYILLIPVLASALVAVAGGARGALYDIVVFTIIYWAYLNADRYIKLGDIKRVVLLSLVVPFVILSGLVAQVVRPLLRSSAFNNTMNLDFGMLWDTVFLNANILNPDNPLLQTMYFGLTELLHRLSGLREQFLILNDHYVNIPWETFSPLYSIMRVVNALVPGNLFAGVSNINQLFHHIYFDETVVYASHMWSIQGTLYLYFGFLLSPVIVFGIAMLVGRYNSRLEHLATVSPAFAVFCIFLFQAVLENGTVERIIPILVVRPLMNFFLLITMVNMMYVLFPRTIFMSRARIRSSGQS